MASYSVSFKEESPIWKLYQELKKDGAKDENLDIGYPDTDYVKKQRTQIKAGDNIIQDQEVLNFALEKYGKYQQVIKDTTGYIVPWSLDDLDTKTTFDAEVRQKARRAITAFEGMLRSKGLTANGYKELLGLSIYAFAMAPKRDGGRKIHIPPDIIAELKKEGLDKVTGYIERDGGLGLSEIKTDCAVEATAIGAMERSCGRCTEQSYVLYALFRMATLKASLVSFPPNNEDVVCDTAVPSHVSVALSLDKRTRFFDPVNRRSDASIFYKSVRLIWWFEMSVAESLSAFYSNIGGSYKEEKLDLGIEELKKAIQINPNGAYFGAKRTPVSE